jgi:alpha-L-rhamnosidase
MTSGIKISMALTLVTIIGCSTHDWKTGIVEEQFIYDTASFPSCHASTIAETPAGLIAAWFGGTYERNPDVCIYTSRLIDDIWTQPVMVADGVQGDTLRYPTWNPVLYQIPDGDLMLFYKVGPNPREWWGMLKRSGDNGKTWSEPAMLPEGFIGPVKNKPVLLDDGTLICPSSTEHKGWRVHFEITRDFGESWEMIDPICDGRRYNVIQPSILIHKNGDLQILCRSRNAVLATSWSGDNGKTWSLIKESGLPNNQSGTDAVTLSDGRHLVVYNHVKTPVNAGKGYRTPLNVAYSKDGKRWLASLILEDSEISQYSYPAVIQSGDGMVHITYTWRREKIKYVKVDPSKLKGREIIDEIWPGNPEWN